MFALLVFVVIQAGCAVHAPTHVGECKMRAYLYNPLETILEDRELQTRPPRIAIIPFTVPPNLTSPIRAITGLGHDLAWDVQRHMLASEGNIVVEMLSRDDWPGKRDEFTSGNYGAISQGYEAGYDYVVVGMLSELRSLTEASLSIKVIDVKNQTTKSYFSVQTHIPQFNFLKRPPSFISDTYTPSAYDGRAMFNTLAECGAARIWREDDSEIASEDNSATAILSALVQPIRNIVIW